MSSELTILALYGLWVILVILAQVLAAAGQVGLPALAGPRDDMPPLTGTAGRLDRAQKNSVVALALFAPAVLLVEARGLSSASTLLAAQLFLAARVLYVVVYVIGTPWLRTLLWVAGALATAWLYLLAI
ncbi:MAG: MAPEG family protein [Rhodobacteraceae bacterium]|nr:MAPEG family protein [Paracoccaceae bacterium]